MEEKFVKSTKLVLIDGKALYVENGSIVKEIIDSLKSMMDYSNFVIMTSEPDEIKRMINEAFMIEQEEDVPYIDVRMVDGKEVRARKIKKEKVKFSSFCGRIVEIPDDAIKAYIRSNRSSSSFDLWVISTSKKTVLDMYGVDDFFKIPNENSLTTNTGSKFRIFFVEKTTDWIEIAKKDVTDVVKAVSKSLSDVNNPLSETVTSDPPSGRPGRPKKT